MGNTEIDKKIEALENSYSKLQTLENSHLIKEITETISKHVKFEDENRDSTDGILDVLGEIVNSIQEKFEELAGISNDKSHFINALTKIFSH